MFKKGFLNVIYAKRESVMKIFTLIEDGKHPDTALLKEHGLSLYFKHGNTRILFDTGASDAFIYNATLLGIDLFKVDVCVLSHVHRDHIGGLVSANIFPTKKRAREVADYWNRRFMENGTYFFDGGKTA